MLTNQSEMSMTKTEVFNKDDNRIGWIGVGNLGEPICKNLLRSSIELCVCDINPKQTAKLADEGAVIADTPAEVAKQSQIVFSAMPSDEALLAIVSDENGLAGSLGQGQIFVDISTVSPRTSANVAKRLEATGCSYLRATVSGSQANAEAGTLGMFCSGPRKAFDQCLPILQIVGKDPSYNGSGEEARILKLLVNIIVIATPILVGEALAFGRRSGLDWKQMIDAISSSVGASPVINYKTDSMKERDWTPMATIDLTAKDLALALEWGRENRVPMPFASLVQQLTSGFQASGDGDKDFFYTLTWPERVMGENEDER